MALPLALLIIGGSLRTGVSGRSVQIGISTVLKLLVLPLTGLILFRLLDVSHALAVPSIILLSSPSATISYVMSAEMGGDSDLAAAAVTISTVLSIITYTFWLSVAGNYL
jgi:predicted permease